MSKQKEIKEKFSNLLFNLVEDEVNKNGSLNIDEFNGSPEMYEIFDTMAFELLSYLHKQGVVIMAKGDIETHPAWYWSLIEEEA